MVVKSTVGYVFGCIYNSFRYCVDIAVLVTITVTSFFLMMLNFALSILVLLEEIVVLCLLLPWIPCKKIGGIVSFIRRRGFPIKLNLAFYLFILATFVTLSLISLELHYLQVNDTLLRNFDQFKDSLFTFMKLFLVMHRLLHLLSNEAILRNTCFLLKKRLKIEQNEEIDDKEFGEINDEELEINSLRGELERTKLDLEAMQEAYSRLHKRLESMSEHHV